MQASHGGFVFHNQASQPPLTEDNEMLTRRTAVIGSQVSWVIQQPDKHLGVQKTEELNEGRERGGRESQRSLEGRRGIP